MTTGPAFNAEIEAAGQRVQELSNRVLEQAKQNGLSWLEGYERVLQSMLELEEQAARGTGSDWVSTLATTHAAFVRETSEVIFGTVREQLKQ